VFGFILTKEKPEMRQIKRTDEQIVALLREAEKGEQSIAQLARENQVTEQTIYRWRRKLGGSTVPDVRRLKQLEKENARLLRQREVEIDGMKELFRKKW
jgi:putative transposase